MSASPSDLAKIETIAGALPATVQQDLRSLFQSWSSQINTLNGATGQSPAGNQQNASAPAAPGLSAQGSNGTVTLTITPPNLNGVTSVLWYEVSYSATKTFQSGVTTLPATAATSMTLNLPGSSYFFRVRCSTNRQVWSAYALASEQATDAGLVSSAATASGAAFAQTNYGVVTSKTVSGTPVVEIQGAGGSLTSMVAVKSGDEQVLPAAAIVNATPGSSQFVGWDGSGYQLKPTLAAVLNDGLTPIGKVNVAQAGAISLPTITLVLGAGGQVVGWNVIDGGANLNGAVTLTIDTSTGSGATPGAQTIVGGVLTAIAPGNPGKLYASGDTVSATGGGSSGQGGGTAAGGNGGRMTNV